MCVDSTHGTNGYDFLLITVVVIDDYGEGFPVAWCISNREDQNIMLSFFQEIKKRVGTLTPKWFMSDLAEQFYTAWVATFTTVEPPNKLLCIWHVDRAWRENLKQFSNDQLKVTLYHNLRILLEEVDTHKFELLLEQTIKSLRKSSVTCSFADYFDSYYVKRKMQWAACYRKKSFITTNMYVEAFHKVLKYVYLKGKVNKRLDVCIGTLLKLARDKGFERLIKLEKGKNSERIKMINVRHQSSMKLPLHLVQKTDEFLTWEVKSADGNNSYHVVQQNDICPYNCYVKCTDCNVCIHMYSCDCPDSLIRATICKHVHLLVQSFSSSISIETLNEAVRSPILPLQRIRESSQATDDPKQCQENIHNNLMVLSGHVKTISNIQLLQQINTMVKSALNLIKAKEVNINMPKVKHQPSNTLIQPQRRFFSTKKKRSRANVRLAKPTDKEKLVITELLVKKSQNKFIPMQQNIYCELIFLYL